jgi:hypothetical protein
MRTSNLANEAIRHAEVGQVWEEVLSGAAGTIILKPFQTFRVRAAGAVTVTIDSTLAATMISGEILVFNAGGGAAPAPGAQSALSVSVAVTGTAFVQVARDNVRKS